MKYCTCFPMLEHFVTTPDGYILRIFQLDVSGGGTNASKNEAVLMQHGFMSNSNAYTALANVSLACLAAYAGERKTSIFLLKR